MCTRQRTPPETATCHVPAANDLKIHSPLGEICSLRSDAMPSTFVATHSPRAPGESTREILTVEESLTIRTARIKPDESIIFKSAACTCSCTRRNPRIPTRKPRINFSIVRLCSDVPPYLPPSELDKVDGFVSDQTRDLVVFPIPATLKPLPPLEASFPFSLTTVDAHFRVSRTRSGRATTPTTGPLPRINYL